MGKASVSAMGIAKGERITSHRSQPYLTKRTFNWSAWDISDHYVDGTLTRLNLRHPNGSVDQLLHQGDGEPVQSVFLGFAM